MRWWKGAWVLAVLFLALGTVQAADDVSGRWKVAFTPMPGGKQIETSMTLKQEGEKVTGNYVGRDGKETKIEEGAIKNGELTFLVNREIGGNKMTLKFKGKVDKDTIKGKIGVDIMGETREFDWEGKKEK